MNASKETHVVIVGGGFAGVACAKGLAGQPGVRLTVIDRNNYNQFQPLLYQIASAQIAPMDVAVPLREIFRANDNVDVKVGTVLAVDAKTRTVTFQEGDTLRGDVLVLAVGCEPNFFNTPGAQEHAYPLYSLADALRLRSRILDVFERADRNSALVDEGALTFVVVGGGPTGVETAGALADLVLSVLPAEYKDLPVSATKIVLVDLGTVVLRTFSDATHEYVTRQLGRLGVELRLGVAVKQVAADHVVLGDGNTIKSHCVIWAGGLKAVPLAAQVGVAQGPGGRLEVDHDLTVAGRPDVYVLGDVASIAGPDGHPLPQLGSVALQSGEWAARNILADLAGTPRRDFRYRDQGIMAMVGQSCAVAEVGARRHELEGPIAYAAWLGVHAALLTGTRTKLSALVNWVWNYLSPRRPFQLLDRGALDTPKIGWHEDHWPEPEGARQSRQHGETRDTPPT